MKQWILISMLMMSLPSVGNKLTSEESDLVFSTKLTVPGESALSKLAQKSIYRESFTKNKVAEQFAGKTYDSVFVLRAAVLDWWQKRVFPVPIPGFDNRDTATKFTEMMVAGSPQLGAALIKVYPLRVSFDFN